MTDNMTLAADNALDFARIGTAIAWLEAHYRDQPSLEDAADAAGLSPYHFQRLFTRWTGISPKRFVGYLTLEDAKARLEACASVLEASWDAGLSGPSRLHDLFTGYEAVTPGEYKARGQGLTLRYGYAPTPLGEAILVWSDRGICGMGFTLEMGRAVSFDDMKGRWPDARYDRDDAGAASLVAAIFNREGRADPVRLSLVGTNFQVRVWEALMAIPEGAVTTYAAIAARLGDPRAVRAVGTAVGRNPVSLLIPCHRVLRKSGELAGYHWGLRTKRMLLAWEGARRDSQDGHAAGQAM